MVSAVLVALVFIAADALARHSARREAAQRLQAAAEEVIRSIHVTRAQRAKVFARIGTDSPEEMCSPDHVRRMRKAVADASHLQGVGVVIGNSLRCITLTELEAPVDLGPSIRDTEVGLRTWTSVQLRELPEAKFNLNARGNYLTLTVPEHAVDVLPADSPLSVTQALISHSPALVIRQNGWFDPAWLEGFDGRDKVMIRDDHLVLIHVMPQWQSAFVAAMPRQVLAADEQLARRYFMPPAVLLALMLVGVVGLVLQRKLSVHAAIADGLAKNEFHVLYQPVIDLRDGRCVGAEALVRWQHDGQQISPADFIPVAEKSGLICRITDSVLGIVANDARSLIDLVPEAHIGINLSARDIDRPRIPPRLLELTRKAGIVPHNIVIEVTEYGLLSPEHAIDILASVREAGFRVAVDDFGTGHSSLSYLASYKLDFLKIDKSFVDVIDSDDKASALAFHIIEIAKSMGLEMIAEGVETKRQRDVLRAAGVRYAQGWLFGHPMPIADLLDFTRNAAGLASNVRVPVA